MRRREGPLHLGQRQRKMIAPSKETSAPSTREFSRRHANLAKERCCHDVRRVF
eukprot:TRINITY_DN546_c0_g1_i1.p2 TRINITY_DN546_c0_g1~~TRINITY_DN546_c0_g1_i1.p2  ORF type:complete len:53 (-),score=6.30 TRINITY_DN546_c0_g1_i1:39-197(-)